MHREASRVDPTVMSDADLKSGITAFAATISSQPLGLAKHRPEAWGHQLKCFENVGRKVQQDGGRGQSGWMFQYKYLADDTRLGYLIAIHHAVWHAPNSQLVDVTPFHSKPQNHPLCPGDGVLFLVDDSAPPVITDKVIAPLPSRFFPLSSEDRLVNHVKRLEEEERQACQRIYDQGSPA
jgi:hypothetical protein